MNFEFMLIIPILTYTVKSFDIPCWSSSFTIFDCCKVQTDTYSQELLLRNKLKNDVFGQHIAQGKIGKMIFSHAKNKYPRKALVMSFHGWTGNGKNFVAKQIVDALYVEGMKNRNVHIFFSTLHFPKEDQVDIYKIHLIDWIRGNVSRCDRSMFIFDEVDKMPPGLLDAIKPFMDYHVEIDGVDYRKSIFLLLSNTGGHDITQKSLELWKKGRKREEFKYEDFEKLIQMGAFNEPGGLFRADIVDRSLVDFYLPFLPMEKDHIKRCVEAEFRRRGYSWSRGDIETISDSIEYWPPDIKLYSVTGCKRIYQLVATKIHEREMAHWLTDSDRNEL